MTHHKCDIWWLDSSHSHDACGLICVIRIWLNSSYGRHMCGSILVKLDSSHGHHIYASGSICVVRTRLNSSHGRHMYGSMCVIRILLESSHGHHMYGSICVKIDLSHSHHVCELHVAQYGWYVCIIHMSLTCTIHVCDVTHEGFDMFDMPHSYVRHDSYIFICVAWFTHKWQDSWRLNMHNINPRCLCVAWHIHTCDRTHSYVWRDAFIRATGLIHMCGVTHSYVRQDSSICAPWLIHMCSMTHAHVACLREAQYYCPKKQKKEMEWARAETRRADRGAL